MDRIIRLNAIIEVLRGGTGRVQKIFIQKEKGSNKIGEIIRLAKAGGTPFVFMPRAGLDELAPGHQGAVAVLAAREFVPLEDILGRSDRPFLVLLDEVEDPQNLGAIIRTAEAAGADGLVLPERHAAGLTETVMEVSAGAAEHLPVARVKNLAQTMTDLKARGLWLVGAEAGSPDSWPDFDYTVPVGIVLGSEGHGLRRLTRERCDKLLSIPLFGRVNSLNVAAAAAVFLFEVIRQRRLLQRLPPTVNSSQK
jgi:23S rRNA (guanosine2251-2'-O)-methyltransferase